MKSSTAIPTTTEIQRLYAISRIVVEASDWKPAMDKIVSLIRSTFIFDNLVVYTSGQDNEGLDVMYARALGRGRAGEADIAWGEDLSNRISREVKTIVEEPTPENEANRLSLPYLLGVPICFRRRFIGSLIFVRFGGPRFSEENIHLAEFISNQVSILIERKHLEKAEEGLKTKHKQIQLQEDFISTISHELRSPLGFIKGYTTTLLRSDTTWDQETQRDFLQIIDRETDHLQELMKNLLDSARLQSGLMEMKFQPVRIDSLLGDMIVRARTHNPRLVINLQMNQPLVAVQGDPLRLSQVFENLISNTLKYAPSSEILIKIEQDNRGTYILFKDFGPGMSAEFLPMIFNRFFRGPDQSMNSQGSGLGLFICKEIIEAHYGQINAESDIGQGMVFHIFLPYDLKSPETKGGF